MPAPSLTRNQVKHLRSLRKKKYRQEHQQFIAEGETIVAEILAARPPELRYVVCTPAFLSQQSPATVERLNGQVYCCDQKTLDAISALDASSPVMAVQDMRQSATHAVAGLSLYLDGLRDPGNLGTILRVADWFGLSAVYLSDDCVDVYNAKAIQASMGAFLRVNFHGRSLAEIRNQYPQLTILGTCISGGSNALTSTWQSNTLLVIGSESHGVRPEIHGLLDGWMSIPGGPGHAGAESLNAGVATGILCAAHLRATCHRD